MKISEAIAALSALQKEHGDLELVNDNNDYPTFSYAEADDENEEAILVE